MNYSNSDSNTYYTSNTYNNYNNYNSSNIPHAGALPQHSNMQEQGQYQPYSSNLNMYLISPAQNALDRPFVIHGIYSTGSSNNIFGSAGAGNLPNLYQHPAASSASAPTAADSQQSGGLANTNFNFNFVDQLPIKDFKLFRGAPATASTDSAALFPQHNVHQQQTFHPSPHLPLHARTAARRQQGQQHNTEHPVSTTIRQQQPLPNSSPLTSTTTLVPTATAPAAATIPAPLLTPQDTLPEHHQHQYHHQPIHQQQRQPTQHHYLQQPHSIPYPLPLPPSQSVPVPCPLPTPYPTPKHHHHPPTAHSLNPRKRKIPSSTTTTTSFSSITKPNRTFTFETTVLPTPNNPYQSSSFSKRARKEVAQPYASPR